MFAEIVSSNKLNQLLIWHYNVTKDYWLFVVFDWQIFVLILRYNQEIIDGHIITLHLITYIHNTHLLLNMNFTMQIFYHHLYIARNFAYNFL